MRNANAYIAIVGMVLSVWCIWVGIGIALQELRTTDIVRAAK